MIDIQGQTDDRNIAIDQVGVVGLRHPIHFADGAIRQDCIATFSLTVGLPADRRGTHMSRFVELVSLHLAKLDPRALPAALERGIQMLDVATLTIAADFAVSLREETPVSRKTSSQVYDVSIVANRDDERTRVVTSVTADVSSLCPCSKAISDYGAHSQRSSVSLAVVGTADNAYPMGVQDCVTLIRSRGSAPTFSLVKRADERHLTMQAFDNPAFVEDIAREVSSACRSQALPHHVEVRSYESIHSHDAVAAIEWNFKG